MAKIWFVADGVEIKGRPTERTVLWCKDILGLAPTDWRAPIKHKFVVNDKTPQSDFANPRHVIITIEENEGGWKDGFYYSPIIRIENVKRSLDPNQDTTGALDCPNSVIKKISKRPPRS